MILLSNANLVTQAFLSVMSSLVFVTKNRGDSSHDKIMVNKSQLQKGVDLMKAVGGGQDGDINGEAINKALATRCATVWNTAMERHTTVQKDSELVSYISLTDAIIVIKKSSTHQDEICRDQKLEEVPRSIGMMVHTSLAKKFQCTPYTPYAGREHRKNYYQNRPGLPVANNRIHKRGLGRASDSDTGNYQRQHQRPNNGVKAGQKYFFQWAVQIRFPLM